MGSSHGSTPQYCYLSIDPMNWVAYRGMISEQVYMTQTPPAALQPASILTEQFKYQELPKTSPPGDAVKPFSIVLWPYLCKKGENNKLKLKCQVLNAKPWHSKTKSLPSN